jgi:hypothetical protein
MTLLIDLGPNTETSAMSTPINPKKATVAYPTQAIAPDGTTVAFDPTDIAGLEFQIDAQPAVSIPANSGVTTFDITTLAGWSALSSGSHALTAAVVTKEGLVGAFSAAATFLRGNVPLAPAPLLLV